MNLLICNIKQSEVCEISSSMQHSALLSLRTSLQTWNYQQLRDTQSGSEADKELLSKKIDENVRKHLKEMAQSGRTPALWIQFHDQVQLIRDFIRAERLSDFDQHLAAVACMLPVFAATTHSQYAKGARLYLELMDMKVGEDTALGKAFREKGCHTVNYRPDEWIGAFTDQTIEEKFMRPAKSRGGMTGGRLRNQDSSHKVWTTTVTVESWLGPMISIFIKSLTFHDSRLMI